MAAGLVLVAAGCGTQPAPTSPAAPKTPGSSPSTTAHSPFKVQILSAGPLTAAQQEQYGMDSPAVVYQVTNISGTPGRPDVTVQFLNGQNVVSSGFAGALAVLQPGQSETAAEGDSLPDGGTGQPWKAVSIISVTGEDSGYTQTGTYPVPGVSATATP